MKESIPTVSGLYVNGISGQELRLDVDGDYSQMRASGVSDSAHWISTELTSAAPDTWAGTVWYRDPGGASFPYSNVYISVDRANPQGPKATVAFSGAGPDRLVQSYDRISAHFHTVEFEYDFVEGTQPVTSIRTHDHPVRPLGLVDEVLTIETVYDRTGFEVTVSDGSNRVPLSGAGMDAMWTDAEMHDAMQQYWSHFSNEAKWSLWVLFASLHIQGPSLGGIMFDDIGPNHRQGTAIFNDSFIKKPPPEDVQADAWVRRMRFWTACHEMGHAFNLAHSWQKNLGHTWIPRGQQQSDAETRSFMNYPFRVLGGQEKFFETFEFRFCDEELLFLRHAPARFVEMGNADWFDNHAFRSNSIPAHPLLAMELRVNRPRGEFEFLEPVVLEVKLKNVGDEPVLIPEKLIATGGPLIAVIKKDRAPARQFVPYAHYCWRGSKTTVMPGDSVYESLFVSAGLNGWDMCEPGYYTVQAAVQLDGAQVASNPLRVRVAPPMGHDEEYWAQDFFSEDVGRVLNFDGSAILDKGNDILREVSERLANRRVAIHSRIALGSPSLLNYKRLALEAGGACLGPASEAGGKILVISPNAQEAKEDLIPVLTEDGQLAAETLGHIDYNSYVSDLTGFLASEGENREAGRIEQQLFQTLSSRKVKETVLETVKERADRYMSQ